MRAGKVMDILQISRSTLKRYREQGILKATELPTGQFDFDEDSVFLLKNQNSPRLTILYGRVSTYKQKANLGNQMQELMDFASANGYKGYRCFEDIDSGISFKKRKEFFEMLDLVIAGKVKRVVITHKDRLSCLSISSRTMGLKLRSSATLKTKRPMSRSCLKKSSVFCTAFQ